MNNECLADIVKRRRRVLTKKQGIEGEILQRAVASGDITRLTTAIEKSSLDNVRTIMQQIAGYAPQDYVTRVSIQEVASGKIFYKVGEPIAAIRPATEKLDISGKGLFSIRVEASPAADVESSFNAVWLGIEASGKSSLIERIRQGEFVAASATIGLNVTSFVFEGMRLVNCDLSGHRSFRSIWDSLIVGTPDIIIYVVDGSDSSTTSEAGDVLTNYVLRTEHLKSIPLLVSYNKLEVNEESTVDELNSKLGLPGPICGREWKAFRTSAKSGAGISDVLEWILQQIKARNGASAQ
jgi:GTPase SAR1 family protein